MSLDSPSESGPSVASVVFVRKPDELAEALAAVERQVYGPADVFVVGGGAPARAIAEQRNARWAGTLNEVLVTIADRPTYLWLLHDTSRPRPDALAALVQAAERLGAGVAGSKILRRGDPEILESVGLATDAFGVEFTGLDEDERDQEQYDVVRDVASVSGASMLVRRDLLRGIGGLDRRLAPHAAALDLCQRARLRGARIVVVPSSEVLAPPRPDRAGAVWREEAGRLRAAFKVYSPLTLAWLIPAVIAVGLAEAVAAPFLGRWSLFATLRAWAWNLLFLPSTFMARQRARAGRLAGDDELFRFQVKGSARLRTTGSELAVRIAELLPEEGDGGLTGLLSAGRTTLRSAGFVSGLIAAAYTLLASREIWSDSLPAVGFSLPPASGATGVLGSYAGGWNPAGLGSPEPMPPAVAVVALAQRLLGDRPDLAAGVLTVAALWAGVIGMSRVLRSWGLEPPAAYTGGVVLVMGPAAAAIGDATLWTSLLALGVLPWAVRVATRPWPGTWRGRTGRIAAVAWLTGLTAALTPALLVAPLLIVVAWSLTVATEHRFSSIATAAAGIVPGAAMLLPWIWVTSASRYLEAGPAAYWDVWPPAAVAVVVTAAIVVAIADRALARIAGWGIVLAAAGALVARSGDFGWGREVGAAGLAIAAMGVAGVAATAVELYRRLDDLPTLRKAPAALAVGGGLLIVVTTLTVALPGRAGLPSDLYRSTFRFTAARSTEAPRVLIAGPAELLPGEVRRLDGVAYRVISTPLPTLSEAWLPERRIGDEALEDSLRRIIGGEIGRAGQALAEYGIQWIVVLGDSAFEDVFAGRLDLVPLPGLERTVFLSEAVAYRAVDTTGTPWRYEGDRYVGPGGGEVLIAETADQRWSAETWEQAGWANLVRSDAGAASFSSDGGLRSLALLSAALAAMMFVVAVWGVGRRAR